MSELRALLERAAFDASYEQLDDIEAEFRALINEHKMKTLKKIASKPHGGENKSQDYKDGYNEMRGKILFEVKRLSKGVENE